MNNKNQKEIELLSYHTDPALSSMTQSGYHCCIVNPFCTNEHMHDFYELTYCISGHAIHLINHREILIESGTLLIMRPDEAHYFKDYSDANALTVCITSDEFLSFLKVYSLEDCIYFKPVSQRSELPPHLKASAADSFYLQNLCENIIASATPNTSPYLKCLLGHALGMVVRQAVEDEYKIPKSLRHSLTQMNQLDNARGGVKAFLTLSNLSHAQLCRLTRKYLNMTPHEYVNSIRMKWAYSLVANSDIDMGTLAESIGFSSYSHFYKLFKETYHISPTDLRKQN